jgi:hypothetical protein
MPLATDGLSGERADDPLYGPGIERVPPSLGHSGLWVVGDGKRAAPATRAFIALAGEDDLCPLSQVHLETGELDEALGRVGSGEPALPSLWREPSPGQPERVAQGYEHEVPISVAVEGKRQRGMERRWVVRSVRHAEAALERAVRRLGWRVYSPHQPAEPLSLEQAVWAYRSDYLVERSRGRLEGRPLSLTPMDVHLDDPATGLIRW